MNCNCIIRADPSNHTTDGHGVVEITFGTNSQKCQNGTLELRYRLYMLPTCILDCFWWFPMVSWRRNHEKPILERKIQFPLWFPIGFPLWGPTGFSANCGIFLLCPISFSWFRRCQSGFETTKRLGITILRVPSDRFSSSYPWTTLRARKIAKE